MAGELHIALLGRLQIHCDGIPLTELASAKAQALLAYLAVTGRPHSREELAGLLWGEMPEADAKTNLRQALALLRRCVGTHLVISREEVEFDRTSSYWLDVEAFQSQISNPPSLMDVNRLWSAVELYRGDFLEGFYVRDAPDLEEWVLAQREHYRERAQDALRALAAHYAAQRECERGLECARRLLALDPWREEAHREVMLLLARSGQRSAALAQFETCRRVLREQLGVEPAWETTTLYERIKAADAMPRHNLPPQMTPFIGRTDELRDLAQHLADPTCRMLTLAGPGGIGKTRLALQAAGHCVSEFLHGVHFVPLAAASAAQPDAMVAAITNVLGFSLRGGAEPSKLLLNHLRDKELLLVLDNLDQFVGSAGLLADILQAATDVKILVTSRERLNLYGEIVFQLGGLLYPDDEMSRDVADCSAVQLFLSSARQADVRRAPAESDLPSVIRICRLLDGLPLGLELAATWTRVLNCADIVRAIERDLDFLATTQQGIPERQRSLRAAFEHSWQMLSAEEQRVFRALSVFRGGFTRQAAESVADDEGRASREKPSPVTRHTTLVTLAALVNKSLVQRDADGRYAMHPAIQQFAEEKLVQVNERDEVRRGLAGYFLTLAEKAEPELTGPQQAEWLRCLAQEHDNLRAALGCAFEDGLSETAARLAGALWRFWFVRGHYTEGRRWLEKSLLFVGLPPYVRAKVLGGLGVFARVQGDIVQAQVHLEECLTLNRALDDQPGVASTLNSLGILAQQQGAYADAQRFFEECLDVRRQLGDRAGAAVALGNLGVALQNQGHRTRAAELYAESLTIKRNLGDTVGMVNSLINLGVVALIQDHYQESQQYLEESLSLARELGDKQNIAFICNYLGVLALFRFDFVQACVQFAECLTLSRDMGHKEGIAEGLEGLAAVAGLHGEPWRAVKLFGASEALREMAALPMMPDDRAIYERNVQATRARLDEAVFAKGWAEGRAMTLGQAVVYALETDTTREE